jgi:hypothetical protein
LLSGRLRWSIRSRPHVAGDCVVARVTVWSASMKATFGLWASPLRACAGRVAAKPCRAVSYLKWIVAPPRRAAPSAATTSVFFDV